MGIICGYIPFYRCHAAATYLVAAVVIMQRFRDCQIWLVKIKVSMSFTPITIDKAGLITEYRPRFRLRFLSPRNWSAWLLLAVVGLCVVLPRPVSAFIGARLGDLYRRSSRKRRNVVDVNLQLCFPELSATERARLSRQHFRIYGQCLIDMGLIWWASKKFLDRYIQIELICRKLPFTRNQTANRFIFSIDMRQISAHLRPNNNLFKRGLFPRRFYARKIFVIPRTRIAHQHQVIARIHRRIRRVTVPKLP